MKNNASTPHVDKQLLLQFSLVFAAFFIMVLISSIFGAYIVNKNIVLNGNKAVDSANETIRAYLAEYSLTLDDISFALERLKNNDASASEMEEEALKWTNWILDDNNRFETFIGVYGVVDGVFIDGSRWIPPGDYVPTERPWYVGAMEKGGGVFFTDPYIDAQSGEFVFTLSRIVFDDSGNAFGVIAIDVFISSISEFVGGLRLLDRGHGVLLDSKRELVVASSPELIGTRIDDLKGGYKEIGNMLSEGNEVSAFSYVDYRGVKSVAFFSELDNGWYVGVTSPRSAYYSDITTMVILLSSAGVIMMVLLCVLLAFLHREIDRSDEANRIKSSFLANMSHEIRTPMNAIIGMTELLINEPLNERQAGFVKDINLSSHSLLSIINDILDLSKIESGKLELCPVNFDFNAFIDNIHTMFTYVSEKKGLDFKFEKKGELPRYLYADDIRLRQVLTNICGNAVKYTSSGSISLEVSAEEETLEFKISDTGMGIRKEDLPLLFNPFEQADAQRNRNIAGTGLGLAISNTFVEMMSGKISVESVYGQGASFTVVIPKTLGDENSVRQTDKKERRTISAPTANVLVVDDIEANLRVASGLLNICNIKAQTALSGKEAIEMVKENKYDVVFMDHMMPEMDGIETTSRIRKMGGEYKSLKIIALTANAIQGAKEMFMSNGFNGFVSKPIDMDELVEILGGLLPPEKIEEQAVIAEFDVSNYGGSAFISAVKGISCINTEIALKRVSGIEEMYKETIAIFYDKLLNECERMDNFVKNKDLHNFSIAVHGIKSTLSTIGAITLSDTAAKLEAESKNNELSYCEEQLPIFLASLRSLHEELSPILQKERGAAENILKPDGSAELLAEKVAEALAAAEDFDDRPGIDALNELLEFNYGAEINESIKNARGAFKDFDYDAALDILNALKDKI